ncbi:MAG: hypothetical protein QY318_03760 [Candidatus Dojkabacteria bacterium]|nr:MAG: hypothetical protein QY318_03760 [Candidatus Dojkabacteria bacterium]
MQISDAILYNKGSNAVLITAPHSTAHRRPSYSGSLRPAELWTDNIALELGERSGAHTLVVNDQLDFDPNYHAVADNLFKQRVQEIVESEKIKYIFDLHGLSEIYPYDFGYYFSRRFYKSKRIAYGLAQSINQNLLRQAVAQVLCFNENLQESIGQFAVKNLGTVAVQLEIARYIREDELLRQNFVTGMEQYLLTL